MKPQERAGRPPRSVLAVKELRCDQIVPESKRRETQLVLLNVTERPSLLVRINEQTVELPRLKETLVTPTKRSSLLELRVLAADSAEAAEAEPLNFQRINAEDVGTRFVIYYSGAQEAVESLLFDDVGMHGSASEEP
jgi:hypothetical protein